MRCYKLCAFLLLSVALRAHPKALGPFGGSAAVVVVDAQRSGTVIAATNNALLFRSTDGGDHWARIAFPAELRARLHAFVEVPKTGDYLVALSDEAGTFSGLFRSTDGGLSWNRVSGLGHMDIWSVAVWPLDGRIIAAGTADGVFLTRDGGEHWTRISPQSNRELQPVVSLTFDIVDSRVLYAGTPHLPWKTIDGGQHWGAAGKGMMDDSDVFSLQVDETRPFSVYATACSGIYRSNDRGAGWTKILDTGDASSRTYQITQDATSPNILLAGTANGLLKSTDRGKTWRRLSNHATRWVAFDRSRPGRVFVATDQFGLFRSDDYGESLRPVNDGFCNRRILSFVTSGANMYIHSVAGSGGSDLFRRSGSTAGWENIALPPQLLSPQVVDIASPFSEELYAITSTRLLISPDGGRTWKTATPPTKTSRLTTLLVRVPDRRIFVGTEGEGIYFSDDAGDTWLQAQLPRTSIAIRSLIALGTQSVAAITSDGLWLSPDGVAYRAVSLSGTTAINGILAISGSLLAATSHGLVRSDDHGTTWIRVPGALDGSTISAICKHPSRPGVLFAAQYGSIYRSPDDGKSWTRVTAPNELPSVRELVVPQADPGTLLVISQNQGVYAVVDDRYNGSR